VLVRNVRGCKIKNIKPKNFFHIYYYRNTLEKLRAILRFSPTGHGAFYVFASNRVSQTYRLWSQQLPTIQPYYAVKSNPDKNLLSKLSSLGSGFDCASARELEEVASIGFRKQEFQKKVVYANPCKPKRDLNIASSYGSPTTVIDSFEEVDKVQGYKGKSLIRILVDDQNSLMPFSRKFGLHSSQVKDLSRYAKSKGVSIDGISFHVGSGCYDKSQYKSAIEIAHNSIAEIREEGFEPRTIDIGGGFLAEQNSKQFKDTCSIIRSTATEKSLRYIAEPGRFFSTTAFDLFVEVIGKKPAGDGIGWRYTIDESLYGQFSCIPFDQKVPTWVRIAKDEKDKPRKRTKGILFGRTCDSLDLIAKSSSMEELEVGDWLWFPYMGAYSSVTASEFNGFPKPPVLHFRRESILLPELEHLKRDELPLRVPFDVTTVSGVGLQSSRIPSVA
jgi:ornithine decarboxylase